MKIWCLFSIANEYDQPQHNLEAWWTVKPDFDALYIVLGLDREDWDFKKNVKKLGSIVDGDEVRIWETDYRLREIEEGKVT